MDNDRKLALGTAGIYFFFLLSSLLYGIPLEDLLNSKTYVGAHFDKLWLLHAIEGLVNCIVSGCIIMVVTGSIKRTTAFPSYLIAKTGAAQFRGI